MAKSFSKNERLSAGAVAGGDPCVLLRHPAARLLERAAACRRREIGGARHGQRRALGGIQGRGSRRFPAPRRRRRAPSGFAQGSPQAGKVPRAKPRLSPRKMRPAWRPRDARGSATRHRGSERGSGDPHRRRHSRRLGEFGGGGGTQIERPIAKQRAEGENERRQARSGKEMGFCGISGRLQGNEINRRIEPVCHSSRFLMLSFRGASRLRQISSRRAKARWTRGTQRNPGELKELRAGSPPFRTSD